MQKIITLSVVLLISSCTVTSKSLKVSTPAFTSYIDVYSSTDQKKQNNKLAFINLHPKSTIGRDHPGVEYVAQSLSHAGYTAYAPEMPYAYYSATLSEAFKIIDKVAAEASKEGKKVIITGHSMGAAVAFLYCSAYTPHESIVAVVLMAPGHMLQLSHNIQEGTALDVQRARKLVKKGKGDVRGDFKDVNQSRRFTISTTPRIYLSYFDPREFPNPATHLDALKVPLLWIDGEFDRAAAGQGFEHHFDRLKKYPQNKYLEVPTGHIDVTDLAPETVLQWVQQFE